jgi:glutathione S-transferase
MLRILGRMTSINVRKVLWTADELGLPYEREDWGLPIRDPHEPGFLALNPNAQVPVIVDDGFVLWESNPIMRYLAERQESSALIPGDLKSRALMEQWLGWQSTELAPVGTYAFLALGRPTPGYDDKASIEASIAKWTTRMTILEAQLAASGSYLVGAQFTLADIAIGLSIHRWFGTRFEHADLPAVEAYYERLRGRAPSRAYLGETTP